MPKHAKLSASGAELWINCSGSVHMAELYPETTSPAAKEGTLAHALAETMIKVARDNSGPMTQTELVVERDNVNAFYSVHKDLGGSFDDMQRILEPYVDFVLKEFEAIRKKDPALLKVILCSTA